jgi:MinD-like ATPase involved in chromosome partitioning or flagellar assembly
MSPSASGGRRGIVYTFYSFKGGVGRSMALANAAALLAKWGHRVLVVDWDLEAPGLERFFASPKVKPDIREVRKVTPGIVDLVQAKRDGGNLHWRDCVIPVGFPDASSLSLLSAGQNGEDYSARLHSLNFGDLFDKHDLGSYIEKLRDEWIAEFDFVLVDSRTGVTDIGGICTVHLADILVLVFTATGSSSDGARQIVDRARAAQERLPLDRGRLLALPLPARDESRTEYQRAAEWKGKFAELFGHLYRDWLPAGKSPQDAIEQLRIPYVPFWSFGEDLPVIEEGTTDPYSLGRAYEVLARFLAARLDWETAMKGQTLQRGVRRQIDAGWLEKHRKAALEGLAACGKKGFTEVRHCCLDSPISEELPDLKSAATQAVVRGLDWPIGLVLDSPPFSPRATSEGIYSVLTVDHHPGTNIPGTTFDYWALNRSGDFYTLVSLHEDDVFPARSGEGISPAARIKRAAEAILHCANLYRALGVDPGAQVALAVRYGGLKGRHVTMPSSGENLHEDEVSVPAITFRLDALDADLVELVKKLCEPLFVIFDFATVLDAYYRRIVDGFEGPPWTKQGE